MMLVIFLLVHYQRKLDFLSHRRVSQKRSLIPIRSIKIDGLLNALEKSNRSLVSDKDKTKFLNTYAWFNVIFELELDSSK